MGERDNVTCPFTLRRPSTVGCGMGPQDVDRKVVLPGITNGDDGRGSLGGRSRVVVDTVEEPLSWVDKEPSLPRLRTSEKDSEKGWGSEYRPRGTLVSQESECYNWNSNCDYSDAVSCSPLPLLHPFLPSPEITWMAPVSGDPFDSYQEGSSSRHPYRSSDFFGSSSTDGYFDPWTE